MRRDERAAATLRGMSSPTHLLVYAFAPGGQFEGQLVGAIERIESSGTLRVLDVLFVMRDADTGELIAVERQGEPVVPPIPARD